MSLFGGKRKDGSGSSTPARPASGGGASRPPAAAGSGATRPAERDEKPTAASAPPATSQGDEAGQPSRRSLTGKETDKLRKQSPHEAPAGGNIVANIGKSIIFKGELSGEEDLEIDGKVEGSVRLPNHLLTIGAHGQVTADVSAKAVQVVGRVAGNVSATERVEIQASGVVEGDIKAPRLLVQEGAVINGAIEMTKQASAGKNEPGKPATETSAAASKPPTSSGGQDVRKSA